jgi:hypothetical protein
MDPGEFVSLLHGRNSCAVHKFLRLLADNPLHEKAAGLVIDALKLLHVEEFIVRELAVKFERVPVLFGGPGRLIVIVVSIANAGNPILYNFLLLSKDPFCSGFNEKSFGDFSLVELVIFDKTAVLGWLNYFGHLGWPGAS